MNIMRPSSFAIKSRIVCAAIRPYGQLCVKFHIQMMMKKIGVFIFTHFAVKYGESKTLLNILISHD